MRLRWPTKYLPRFPAILLVFAVLGLWVVLSTAKPGNMVGIIKTWHPHFGSVAKDGYGFPFVFIGVLFVYGPDPPVYLSYGFNLYALAADLALALATAYLVAMGAERLLFPLARRLLGKKSEQGEPG